MATFKKGHGDWTKYLQLPGLVKVDLHLSEFGPRQIQYSEAMAKIWDISFQALRDAYEQEIEYVLYIHGWSTSRRGKTTARSEVRGLMRSTNVTPYIDRARCIQHESVFVAAIKPRR